jgi:uncharacterized membrane protein
MHGSLSENSTEAVNPEPGTWPAINAAQQFVVVKAPIVGVYDQWSRIEGLPRFITSLREVRRIDDTPNLSRRVEEYLDNFKWLVERAEGRA